MHHDNIIQCKEYFIENNDVVIVLEYARFGDLRNLLSYFSSHSSAIPERVVKTLMVGCLRGVQYIHSMGILHRDIKSQNILITEEGVVKICDFGIAAESGSSSLLQSCVGTLQYMAPEVVKGMEYDMTADVWSLGCVFYELLWRTPLVTNNPYLETAMTAETLNTENLSWPSFYSSALCSIVQSMLQMDRKKRPSADAILSLPYCTGVSLSNDSIFLKNYGEQWFFETYLKNAIPREVSNQRVDPGRVACMLQYNAEYMHRNMEALSRAISAIVTNKPKEYSVCCAAKYKDKDTKYIK